GISEAVDMARRRYEHFNVPRSENKAVIRETTTQSLGEAIDGDRGTIGPPAEFVRRLISLTLATLQRPTVTQKWMQILAGRWFGASCSGASGLVTVSDASMQRGAVCRAVRIRPDGVAAARAASRRLVTDFRDEVVLLSLFDGIGGARRALDLMGLTPALFVSAEIDAEAKRVTKYAWPDVLEVGDVCSFGFAEAVAIRERVPHMKWILVVAGSPCSDLARINVERTGLQGRRSRLFYEINRIVSLLREALGDFCTVLPLVENVAPMDSEPRQLMSHSLGCEPVCISAGDVTHCQRDRLHWIKEELLTPWQGETYVMDSVKHVVIPDGPGPVERWLAAGLQWQGDIQKDFRLFNYCYAPYQFQDVNCIEEPDGSRRPPSSVERELLLDFLPGHTITARVTRARKLEKADLECCRCALLGNSFQCVVVAWVLAHWAQRAGYLTEIPSARQMRETGGGATVADATVSMDQIDCDDGVLVRQHDLESEDAALDPSIIIVEELARRAEARGSDIRLDTFEAMRPDLWPRRPVSVARWSWKATAIWDWKHPSHITDLEVEFNTESEQLRIRLRVVNLGPWWVAYHTIWCSHGADHIDQLDLLVADWIKWLWTEGHPQGLAGNTLSAVQFFLRKKRILPASWRLLRAWQRLELPQRVLPMPDVVLTALAATARGWGRNDVAALLVFGFAAFLRTTEMLTLRRWQVGIDE
ncbi:unnamed protein product, partial [Prorocentrum cordatum]